MARAGQGRNSSTQEKASNSGEQWASKAAQRWTGHQQAETSNPDYSYIEHKMEDVKAWQAATSIPTRGCQYLGNMTRARH